MTKCVFYFMQQSWTVFFHDTISVITINTAQKMKFSIEDFFSECDQIRSFLLCNKITLTVYQELRILSRVHILALGLGFQSRGQTQILKSRLGS